jgi:hypothetical protein
VNHAKNVPESLLINEVACSLLVLETKSYTEMASAKHANHLLFQDRELQDNVDSVKDLHVAPTKSYHKLDYVNHAHHAL